MVGTGAGHTGAGWTPAQVHPPAAAGDYGDEGPGLPWQPEKPIQLWEWCHDAQSS